MTTAYPPQYKLRQWENDILNEEENVDVVLNDVWNDGFRAARRPKPPSPKEQALEALKRAKPLGSFDGCMLYGSIGDFELVLQAVQSLPDDETN